MPNVSRNNNKPKAVDGGCVADPASVLALKYLQVAIKHQSNI